MVRARLGVVCLAAACIAPTGCIRPRFIPARHPDSPVFRGAAGPFAPASLRLHPLTHLERDARGRVYLLAHVQLRDRWSDLCKGVGDMQFGLYEPTGLGGSGQVDQVCRWQIDLYRLDSNALYFDPATQTYRFSLGDLPDWVEQMAPGGDQTAVGPGRFLLRARLTTPTPDGGQAVLVDELAIGK